MKASLLRITGALLAILLVTAAVWTLWHPGAKVRDGRHDQGTNGLWLAHGWLGGDEWFREHDKETQKERYRSTQSLGSLAERLSQHGIADVFPHLCPVRPDGSLPPVNPMAAERFLDSIGAVRVWPWVGGPLAVTDLENAKWRDRFARGIRELLAAHSRFAGVQINIEPLPDGTQAFLLLLDEVRGALPPDGNCP